MLELLKDGIDNEMAKRKRLFHAHKTFNSLKFEQNQINGES